MKAPLLLSLCGAALFLTACETRIVDRHRGYRRGGYVTTDRVVVRDSGYRRGYPDDRVIVRGSPYRDDRVIIRDSGYRDDRVIIRGGTNRDYPRRSVDRTYAF
jgi:hypothetical protein